MSIHETAWAWDQPLPPVHKLVLLAYAEGAPRGTGRPMHAERVAALTGVPPHEVVAIAEELRGRSLLDNDHHVLAPTVEVPARYQKRTLPRELRAAVFARDGYACRECAATEGLSVDHIYPELHGGSDDLENLQTLCGGCNARKGTQLP